MPAKPPSSDAARPGAIHEVETPQGLARVHVREPVGTGARPRPTGTVVLGHGAGGGVAAPDLRAAVAAATASGWRAVLVEQPWRVAGRRVAPAPPRLDEAWLAVLAALTEPAGGPTPGMVAGPLVVGGRSAGARVACRTATRVGAVAVVCLAFPVHPPGRPETTRTPELAGAGVPVVVVQGARDAFGTPGDISALHLKDVEVVEAPGDHALRSAGEAVAVGVRLALRHAHPGGASRRGPSDRAGARAAPG